MAQPRKMGNPWVWREAPLLPVGFWGWGLGPVEAEIYVLTRCLPVSPQESSDTSHTTIEDEDTKVSNLPALSAGSLVEQATGRWGAGTAKASSCDEGWLPGPGRLRLGTDWHWAVSGRVSKQSLADLGSPDQCGIHCPGRDRFSAWAPKLLEGLCTQFPWLNLLFLLSKVLKPVPTQLAVDTWMGIEGISWAYCWAAGWEACAPFPTQGSQAKLKQALSGTSAPGCRALYAHPWSLFHLSFLSCPRRGSGLHSTWSRVTGPAWRSLPLSHTREWALG